jgi:beta-lactamase regulating signal transducer with metallopeptidase domain
MSLLIDAIVRPSLVLGVGLAVVWLLRKQPAALRHWILAATIALAVAQPVISRIVPALPIPVINWSQEKSVAAPLVETEISFEAAPRAPAPAPTSSPADWPRLAMLLWAMGTATSLAILLSGAIWLSWLGSKATEAGGRWRMEAELLRARMGLRRPIRILVTTHPALLVTWGTIAPVILLPADAPAWAPDRIRLVLAHEFAHLIRNDWLIQLAGEVAGAINWFNPLFWMACARLRRESEYACDDIVLDNGIGGTSYATHLIDLARTFSVHGRTWLPAPSIARPSTLERRVRAMLNPQVNRRPVSMMRRAALAALLLVVSLPIAAASQATSTPAGTVVDPNGRPLADAVVRLTPLGKSEQVFETRTDANGAFEFSPVPPGEYMLALRYPGFSGSRQRIQLTAGGATIALRARVGTLQETISVTGPGAASDATRYVETAAVNQSNCTPSTSGGQLTPPMKIRDVRPRYRQEWNASKLEGTILMQARIGTDGTVNADLEDEAMAAVSQWQFTPTYLNCEPIEVQMFVTVRFTTEK